MSSPVENHDLVPSFPSFLNMMADLLSRSNQVQSTEWSLHPQVFKRICQKWFTRHKLTINWYGLTVYAYPPTALLYGLIKKIRHCSCCIIVITQGWPGMPWFWDLVQVSTEIPLQLPVSMTLLKTSDIQVFHNNPQFLNLHAWCRGVDNSKNKASLWKWQRELRPLKDRQPEPSTNQSGHCLRDGVERILWISPLPL